jgi:hypothetical protein
MQKLKDYWAKVEAFWAGCVGWIAVHPKTSFTIIAALVLANLIRKP